jgi:ArsR family transcriptional regulator
MDRDHLQSAMRLKALGHPVRLGIALRLAAEPETCACDFAELFGVSQPTVSQHLRVLREAGLVTTRRHGTQICYSLDVGGVRAVQAALAELATPALRSA